MGFSYGMLVRSFTKAARNVNEMVQQFPAMKLTRYSKIERDNGLVCIDPMG
jgi:hypothetical protein